MLSEIEWQIIILSLKVASAAILFSFPLAVAFAWLLARHRFYGKLLIDGLIHLPLILPPVVVGYLLLLIMGRQGIIGSWLYQIFGISFSLSWKGAALAASVVAFPLMVRSLRLAFENVDPGLESAARLLGASKLRVFATITLPLSLQGVFAGVILAFARALGEFGATITFVSNIPGETRILPLAMYTFMQMSDKESEVLRLCLISITLSLFAMIFSEWLLRRHQRYRSRT